MNSEDYKSAFDLTSRSLQKIISEEWLKSYWEGLPVQLQAGSFIEIGEVTQKRQILFIQMWRFNCFEK